MNNLAFLCCFLLIFCPSCPTKTREKQIFKDGERRVFVLDDIFPSQSINSFYNLVSFGKVAGKISSWFYTKSDNYQDFLTLNATSNSPWMAAINPEFFMKTALWNIIQNEIELISAGKNYFPYEVAFTMHRRLDFITEAGKESAQVADDLMVRICLNKDFKKNDYGETLFYRDSGEILAAVHPKMGRMMIWNASVPFIFKPPAMSYLQAQYDIIVRLSTSKEKADQKILETKRQIENCEKQDTLGFALSDQVDIPVVDLSKFEKKRFHDSLGREIAVFDGLLNSKDLDALRLFLLQYNSAFMYQGFDTSGDEEHDNVSWIAMLKVKDFVTSRLWRLVKQLAAYLSGINEWYPYDVSMNIIRNSHFTRIHQDCEPSEHEYTFLLYLTPDWEVNNYGETVFFEELFNKDGRPFPPGKQQYEWLASVRPRYGRMVIFRGIIPHSARPPSPGFNGVRYTFACKISSSYRLAISKALGETLEYLDNGDNDDPEAMNLLEKLSTDDKSTPTTEFIEEKLVKYRQKRDDAWDNKIETILKQLTASKSRVNDEL
ncbi:uncharacterized protein LOC141884239 [Acropora palmata]|uniref:uncharacterized protein LOC141884239 n=1 Tax=Acropora palmata TaxID=6131 RepID=UPI003DA02D2E